MNIKRALLTAVSLVLCMSLVLSFASCGKKNEEKEPVPDVSSDEYSKLTPEDIIEKYIKDKNNISLEDYTALLSTLAYVPINNDTLELEDNNTARALNLLGNGNAVFPEPEKVVEALIHDKSPQVRGFAVTLAGSLLESDEENLSLLKDVIKNEKEPYVLKCATDTFAFGGAEDPDIGKFLVRMTKNDNKAVRLSAVYTLSSTAALDIDGAADAVIALMGDSEPDVRKAAYKFCGAFYDDRAVEPIVKMLSNSAEADYHAYGLLGLITMWYDYPGHAHTSAAAYKATVNYFKTVRPSQKTPPLSAISALSQKTDETFDSWKQQASYYNADELVQIMKNLVSQADLSWQARVAAMKVIAVHGTKADMDSLKAVTDSLKDEAAELIRTEYEKIS